MVQFDSNKRTINPIFFIALGLFGLYTIEFGIVGILPTITERFNVSTSQAGLLVGMFALVVALLGPFMVLLLSKYNRKHVLVMSLLIFSASSLLSAYTSNFYILLALRMIPALFHPVYFSMAFVAASSLYPKEKATQASAKAFVGTSMGMVLGIPITTYIVDQFSFEASFIFCALVNAAASVGIAFMLPKTSKAEKVSYGEQLSILRKVPLWINIGAATFIFAAMFSVYSYSAEYLKQVMGMSGEVISVLLVIFGVGGVVGNLLAGKLIGINKVRTTVFHPILLALTFILLYLGATSIVPVIVIMVLWGAAHTSGLIVTQIWLTAEAPEAPEFANGLYISFINLGVSIGSLVAGWFLTASGMKGTIWSGLLFIILALVCIAIKILYENQKGREKMLLPPSDKPSVNR
ncbi:MFS transporter [Paenibacillus baekrokdamisoli]|uniref:MFS transporter n=1 Tax=Paenibacillus baekrokdamisoli TaxID=1712516 RepID=A0A3G9J5I4_9BACL|nr:MFS transporter [Paenibacillus baekrokdamisoli]MBB3070694.1 putative MFS family arabinose efflux permease [Paenibacillus baekrokdamisoli]BBH20043.1 MFS transporter [Paenibacillus baekrokdamisoli]